MSWQVRYSQAARVDLKRLYGFLLEQDMAAAQRALRALDKGVDLIRAFPFTCRKADPADPMLRELLVSFGSSGYVMLYEISDDRTLTILAVRHQREDDYH